MKNKLPAYRTIFYARLIVDTKFYKKGDIVEITDYNNHEGGQWIMDNGIWFNENQLENINKLSKD